MPDLTNPRLIYAKGLLFLIGGVLASVLLLLEHPSLQVAFFLIVAVWCFARAYYFAFYVIEHYVDPTYRFAGLTSFARHLLQGRSKSGREVRAGVPRGTDMDIQRYLGNAQGRSRAVTFDNLVFPVATAAGSTSLQEQTRQVLARIEQNLRDAGSDKTRLLSATVYLTDIAKKAEMDAVWNEWIGPENWPQRACVQAGLSPGVLVEITVIAARRRE